MLRRLRLLLRRLLLLHTVAVGSDSPDAVAAAEGLMLFSAVYGLYRRWLLVRRNGRRRRRGDVAVICRGGAILQRRGVLLTLSLWGKRKRAHDGIWEGARVSKGA